jgi:phosphate starvation-inducible PhoH-like protein
MEFATYGTHALAPSSICRFNERGHDDMALHLSEVMDYLKKRGYKVGDDPLQLEYVKALVSAVEQTSNPKFNVDGSSNSLFVNAISGTGKTTLATLVGAYTVDRELLDRILYIRAEVNVDGEQRGFLPGGDDEKHEPYRAPFIDALDEHRPGTWNVWSSNLGKEPKAISTHPGHFRGLTKECSFVILDEAQNMTNMQLLTLYTRFKQNCVIVTIGHSGQCDIPPRKREIVAGYLPFEVFSIHHQKKGAWAGTLTQNYRGEFAQWSDQIQQTIDELKEE